MKIICLTIGLFFLWELFLKDLVTAIYIKSVDRYYKRHPELIED